MSKLNILITTQILKCIIYACTDGCCLFCYSGAAALPTEIQNKPEFLADEELKHLMLKVIETETFHA